jgi:hypothetical protein
MRQRCIWTVCGRERPASKNLALGSKERGVLRAPVRDVSDEEKRVRTIAERRLRAARLLWYY